MSGRKRKFLSQDLEASRQGGAAGSSATVEVPGENVCAESGKETCTSGHFVLGEYPIHRRHTRVNEETNPRSKLTPYLHHTDDLDVPMNKAPEEVWIRYA